LDGAGGGHIPLVNSGTGERIKSPSRRHSVPAIDQARGASSKGRLREALRYLGWRISAALYR